jgi:hypothetical protein
MSSATLTTTFTVGEILLVRLQHGTMEIVRFTRINCLQFKPAVATELKLSILGLNGMTQALL